MIKAINPQKYEQFCKDACLKFDLSEEVSSVTANLLVQTDKFGIFTHGTGNLLPYLNKITAGGINAKANPEVVSEGDAWAIIDGHNAMGMYNGHVGMQIGMEKARKTGIAYVGIKNSGHYGACGIYAITAAENGMIALVMSNTMKNMAVPGAKGRNIGNSPIAYAIPAGDHRPIFMDIATSNVAGLKVLTKMNKGEQVPEGWIHDSEGNPTTDPSKPGWALSPMGGHKGYCISFFIEVMCAILSGGAAFEVNNWMNLPMDAKASHSLIVINMPAMIDRKLFEQNMANAILELSEAPKVSSDSRVYLPGEIEWEKYEAAEKNGLILPDNIIKNAETLAQMTGLDLGHCYL